MLIEIREINPEVVDRLVDLYAKSMDDLQAQFPSRESMLAEYASFLAEFVKPENQKIFVEEADDAWVSALRAIETEPGKWFFEAVETKPSARGGGYGSALVRHTLAYLAAQGMTETTCTIAARNLASQKMHGKCGFHPTNAQPLNPWGEVEKNCILYRYRVSG